MNIKLGIYRPNVKRGAENGFFFFNNSDSKTPYQRYQAFYTDPNTGNQIECVVALNAQEVENRCVIPDLLQDVTITVDQTDFMTSLEAQKEDRNIDVLAITEFWCPTTPEMMQAKIQYRATIGAQKEMKLDENIREARENTLMALASGIKESPLRNAGNQRTGQSFNRLGQKNFLGAPALQTTGRGEDPADDMRGNSTSNENAAGGGVGESHEPITGGVPETVTVEAEHEAHDGGTEAGGNAPQNNDGGHNDEPQV